MAALAIELSPMKEARESPPNSRNETQEEAAPISTPWIITADFFISMVR